MTAAEAREVVGMRDALAPVDRLAAEGLDADEPTIREIHRRVLWNQSPLLTPGAYRQGENREVTADGTLVFGTPPSGDVPQRMHELGGWLRQLPSFTKRSPLRRCRPCPSRTRRHPSLQRR
jgi:Fic family protein